MELNYLQDYWPSADGLSAVNVIGTKLRDPMNSGLSRWRMAVIFDRFLSISTNNITPLIDMAVEGRILAGYVLLLAAKI